MNLAASITSERPLVLVGAGKMGGALLSGWLANGLPSAAVHVIDPAPPRDSEALLAEQGLAATDTAPAGVTARVIVLAVKPQVMAEALPPLRSLIGRDMLVLSIAAGTKLETLTAGLGTTAVIRAMPNTPAQIGKGISVAVGGAGVDEAMRELGTALLSAVGAVEWIDDEGLMDAVTAVSGSGPAYVFLLAECLAEAGVEAGLSPELARRLADATVAGSGALLDVSDESPTMLRQNVTSPGGTTAAALDVLMAPVGLAQLMRRAVAAAKRRAKELG
jgi:pyrroline-5-carboxylate reductase